MVKERDAPQVHPLVRRAVVHPVQYRPRALPTFQVGVTGAAEAEVGSEPQVEPVPGIVGVGQGLHNHLSAGDCPFRDPVPSSEYTVRIPPKGHQAAGSVEEDEDVNTQEGRGGGEV